jgi:hypothetical protein
MESQFSSYLDGEHSAQTAKEGVIGQVQLPVGQLAEIGSISSLSMPFQMAALSRNGSIKTRQLRINSLSLSSTGTIEERLTISSRAGIILTSFRSRNVAWLETGIANGYWKLVDGDKLLNERAER